MKNNAISEILLFEITLSRAVLLLATFSVLIDTINGFLILSFSIDLKIAQLYKITILFLAILSLAKYNRGYLIFFLSVFIAVAFGPFSRNFIDSFSTFYAVELPILLRISLFLAIFLTCLEMSKRDFAFLEKTLHVGFYFCFIVIAVNVASGYFGFGSYTYESSDIGYKGFFLAGNEVSALFGLSISYILNFLWKGNKYFRYILFSFISIFLSFSIGTKAAILFSLLAIFITPIFSGKKSLLSTGNIAYGLLIICFIVYLIYLIIDAESGVPAVKRILHVLREDGVLTLILSGRDTLALAYLNGVNDNYGIYQFLFGSGASSLLTIEGRILIEIDPLDIMMYFGVPVSTFLFTLSIYSFCKPLFTLRERQYSSFLFISNISLFSLAIIAGHVWTSGMLIPIWAASFSLLCKEHLSISAGGK